MGGTYMAVTVTETDKRAALEALRATFRADGHTETDTHDDRLSWWPDPFDKTAVQVWPEPVIDCAIGWMRGWIAQNPPRGVDPDDKWGPWMAFPLAAGGWHFFGWVNT